MSKLQCICIIFVALGQAAGLTDRPAAYADLVELIDARAPKVWYARTYQKEKGK